MITNLSPARAFLERIGRKSRQGQFHDGIATIDSLLSELSPNESTLVDAALDLRTLTAEGSNAAACLEQLFRLRTLLGRRHHVAFIRVLAWARRTLRVEVRIQPRAPWIGFEIPPGSARMDEVTNTALARIAYGDFIPAGAQVRFVFST